MHLNEPIPAKGARSLFRDQRLVLFSAGGGGYGDPFERDPRLVLADVLDGFTTLELAERDYGVVIDPQAMTIDEDATTRRRNERTPVPA